MKNFRPNIMQSHTNSSQAFISLYALLLTLSVSFVALHTIRTLSIKKDTTLMLYFQKQSMLYATSLQEIALACIKSHNTSICKHDSVQFDSYFQGEYSLNEDTIQDASHANFGQKVFILDISIHAQTLLSTHPMRYAKRYILKGDT